MGLRTGVSVVIPVYQSANSLSELVARLTAVLERTSRGYEIILVNDGSPDASWEVIKGLAHQHAAVRAFDLARNYGQHNALLAGIRAARHDVIVTLDDDLQHPPEEIPKLLERLASGYDIVYGTPVAKPHSWWRNGASALIKVVLQKAFGAAMAREISAFRAFHTSLRRAFGAYGGPFVSIDVLLSWGSTRFTAVPVLQQGRYHGVSHYTLRALLRHTLNMVVGFSVLPLRFASALGFALSLFGGIVLVYVLGRFIWQGSSVPGFPFLASIITIFSGAQLLVLGIIGEYLAGVHYRAMGRPPYVIRERIGSDR